MGRVAMPLVGDRLRGVAQMAESVVLPVELVTPGSTAGAPSA